MGEAISRRRSSLGPIDIRWEGNSALFGDPELISCNSGVVLRGVRLSASGSLEVDLPTVEVQGAVRVNGQVMPDAGRSRGSLSFVNNQGRSMRTRSLQERGALRLRPLYCPGAMM